MSGMIGPARNALFGLLTLALLAGCEDGKLILGNDGRDILEPGISVGPVTGFGNEGVVVTGIPYGTLGTEFFINEVDGGGGALAKGMLVTVNASVDDDRAARIVYEDDLRGPLLARDFDPITGTFELLGQRVRFNNATVFQGPWSLDEFPELFTVGNGRALVAVSGWYLDSGELLASYVSARQYFVSGLADAKLRGFITRVAPALGILEIGDLQIEYDQNTLIRMANDQNQILATDIGDLVEVEGYLNQLGGPLVAEEIEQEYPAELLGEFDSAPIYIEGAITRGLGIGSRGFAVDGIEVRVDSDTDLEGLGRESLREGRRVFVEAIGDDGSTNTAERILDREPSADVEAVIQDIAPSVEYPNRAGWLIAGGVRVEVNLGTLVVDSETDLIDFDTQFGGLVPGDFIEVAGIPWEDEEGVYLEAVKVERNVPFDYDVFRLRGPVLGPVDRNLQALDILGNTLLLDGRTQFEEPLFSLEDIREDDLLDISYRAGSNGDFIVNTIELDDDGL